MFKRRIVTSFSLLAAGLTAVSLAACGGSDSGQVQVVNEPHMLYNSLDDVAAGSSVIVLAEATDKTSSEPVEGSPDGSANFNVRQFTVKQTIAGTYLDGSSSQAQVPVRVDAMDDKFKTGQEYVLFLAPAYIRPGRSIVDYFPMMTGVYKVGDGGFITREDVAEGGSSPSFDSELRSIKNVDDLIAQVEKIAAAGTVGTRVIGEEELK